MIKYKQRILFFKALKVLCLVLIILTFSFIVLRLFTNTIIAKTVSNVEYGITEPISFLFIGSDYVADDPSREGARADSLMVATLNPSNSRGNVEFELVSIPRDTIAPLTCNSDGDFVNEGDEVYDKITHSFMYGLGDGVSDEDLDNAITCTENSVESLLNIEIDYYVMATFDAVIDVVDAIGGIEVNSSRAFCVEDSEGNGFDESLQGGCVEGSLEIQEGEQILDGEHALGYARERYSSSDYDRNLRQQEVIVSIFKKILSDPVKYSDDFIKVFQKSCKTNVNVNVMKTYINYATALYNNVYINLSEDVPVYIDNKSSIYENIPMYEVSTVLNDSNIDEVSMSEIYGEENIDDFEEFVYVSRHKLTKENTKSATNLSLKVDDSENLEPITIEFSSFSVFSTEYYVPDVAFYSYIDADTLYYISNMLRKSLNYPVEKINYFDYSILAYDFAIPLERNPYYVEYSEDYEESEYYIFGDDSSLDNEDIGIPQDDGSGVFEGFMPDFNSDDSSDYNSNIDTDNSVDSIEDSSVDDNDGSADTSSDYPVANSI